MDIGLCLWGKTCILGSALDFRITFSITFHLGLCQHSQGAKVGSIRRLQLRLSDTVVSPDI